jgi:hypothetical protein
VHVVVVHGRRTAGTWVLLESVVVNAKEPIGTSNRRERIPSGDVVELDERISSLVIDVAEDGEEIDSRRARASVGGNVGRTPARF